VSEAPIAVKGVARINVQISVCLGLS